MSKISLTALMKELKMYQASIEIYKKRLWVKKNRTHNPQEKKITTLIKKIDVLKNSLILCTKRLANKSSDKYNDDLKIFKRSSKKIKYNFQQLDKMFVSIEER